MSRLRAFRKKLDTYSEIFLKFLGSNKFFWIVLGLFVFQALWVAFSFRYPFVFDERYHYLITEYFSRQSSPVVVNQDPYLDQFGVLERSPFHLYHYLMSFPYRIIDMFTDSLAIKVIGIRVVGIAIFSIGIVFLKRLFDILTIPRIATNIGLLAFIMLPIVTIIGGAVSYDGLVFLTTAATLYYLAAIYLESRLNWRNLALFFVWLGIGLMTKISFLPVGAAALLIFTSIIIYRKFRKKQQPARQAISSFMSDRHIFLKVFIVLILVTVGAFAVERYAVNLIEYKKPNPSCTQILSLDRCLSWSVFARDYRVANSNNPAPGQLPVFLSSWFTVINNQLYETSTKLTDKPADRSTVIGSPLPVFYAGMTIIALLSPFFIGYSWRRLRSHRGLVVVLIVTLVYIASLLYTNGSTYFTTSRLTASQGRYLIPFLPIFMVLITYSLLLIFKKKKRLQATAVLAFFIIILSGGGIITHVVRSNEQWNWSNRIVREVNNKARDILHPVTKEYWYDRR